MPTALSVASATSIRLSAESSAFLDRAKSFKITTAATYNSAAEDLKQIKVLARTVEDEQKVHTGPLTEELNAIRAEFKKPKEFLATAESILKTSMLEYSRELQRKADEQQRKLDEAAAAERKKLEDTARRQAAQHREDRAAETLAKAQEIKAPVVVARSAPVVQNVQTRKVWKAKAVDLKTLCRAIADGRVSTDCVSVRQSEIDKIARALKEATPTDIGIAAYSEDVIAASGL